MTTTSGPKRVNRAEAIRLYGEGHSLRAIAEMMGVTRGPVHQALLRAGVEMRPRGAAGSLLTDERREEILEAYRAEETIESMIARLGVSDLTIRRVAEKAGEPPRPRGARRQLDWDQIVRLNDQGWPPDAIAILVDANEQHVKRVLRRVAREAAGDAEEEDEALLLAG